MAVISPFVPSQLLGILSAVKVMVGANALTASIIFILLEELVQPEVLDETTTVYQFESRFNKESDVSADSLPAVVTL